MSQPKKSQLEKFKEAVRQLETDDEEERFGERLKTMVKKKLSETKGHENGN